MVLYEFIEGIEPDIDDKAEEIGELTGKLHKIMTDYPGKLIGRSKDFFIDRYISILRQKAYPDKELAKYIKLGDMLWKTVENLPLGYAHGDLHRGNLLLTPEDKIYFLDFDTSCIAPRMFDIMVMCDTSDYFEFKPEDFEHSTTIFKRFLSAYGKYISLTEDEIRAFYDLVAIRHFQLQATIVEIFGLDCIDKEFIDKQLNWLISWRKMYSN
jgi:Ser/Thr protein kinase RdoA (MazF antagonist)